MNMDQQLDGPQEVRQRKTSLFLLLPTILFLMAAFFASELDWDVSLQEDYAIAADEAEDMVAGGQGSRKISFSAIGLFGLIMLLVPSRNRLQFGSIPFLLILAYLGLCACSLVWSDAPWLTIKRVAILLFSFVGVLGLAKHLSQRDLIVVALGIGMLLLGVGFYAELSLGSFRPWSASYRFAGTVHPNTQGSYCALMVLAAFFGWKGSERNRWLYALLFVIAAGFMLLTKSRNCIAGCLIGIFAAWYLSTSKTKKTLVGIGLPVVVCAAALFGLLIGLELLASVDTAVQMGRGADAGFGTLNGRLPLWDSLVEYVAARPILGYGYHAFWTGERIYEVSIQQEWTVPTAHSAYIDVILSVGLVGAAAFGAIIFIALRRATIRCLATGSHGDAFALSTIVFALASSIFESGFLQPSSFDAFVAACAMCQVLLQSAAADEPAAPEGAPLFLEPFRLDPFPSREMA